MSCDLLNFWNKNIVSIIKVLQWVAIVAMRKKGIDRQKNWKQIQVEVRDHRDQIMKAVIVTGFFFSFFF